MNNVWQIVFLVLTIQHVLAVRLTMRDHNHINGIHIIRNAYLHKSYVMSLIKIVPASRDTISMTMGMINHAMNVKETVLSAKTKILVWFVMQRMN